MDCLVAVPVGWDSRGPLSGHMPSAAAMQALAAHMPAACAVGSPSMRGTMFLPRLCSIPETEAESAAPASKLPETSCVQSVDACRQASVDSSSTAEPQGHQDCSSSPCSCCSSSHEATTSAAGVLQEDDCAAAAATTADLPAVVASTWAISIRHFTDCVPISADSVCSNSTCHATTQPAAAASSASARQQQQLRQAAGQQQGCSSAPRTTSTSSSLSLAAEDDGGGQAYSPPLSGSLSLSDMDALEWQPWDRVAKWLELNAGATGAAPAAPAAPAKSAPAALAKERPSSSSSRSVRDAASPHPGHTASSAGAAASSHSRPEQPGGQQEQEQQQGGGEQEALFDAPDWWQESVKARLEEQREAFHSSWFARLKISVGLAAQRASH